MAEGAGLARCQGPALTRDWIQGKPGVLLPGVQGRRRALGLEGGGLAGEIGL